MTQRAGMTQLTLDDALHQRDAALARVDRDAAWAVRATAAVLACGFDRGPDGFIADQVWPYLGDDRPANPKALGAVLHRLAQAGRIVATGALRPHPKRHATKTLVWRLA